jgi:histidinol-phosphate phosphatase family protein
MAMTGTGRRAVFLDKDGTLLVNVPFNVRPRDMKLTPRAGPALRSLHGAGYELIVVTNQSGVARGYFGESALPAVRNNLARMARGAGAVIAGFYYCPHHPDGIVREYAKECRCRKPAPGLLRQAARDRGLSLSDSWLVGDTLDDVEAGHAAGCRAILLDNGGETVWHVTPMRMPEHIVGDLYEAAEIIVGAGTTSACLDSEERGAWTHTLRD